MSHFEVSQSFLNSTWHRMPVEQDSWIGKNLEIAWNVFKHKLSIIAFPKAIRGEKSDTPCVESAIQSLLGRTRDFKRLKKTLVDPRNQPLGPMKARCKEVVNRLFQNINTFGLEGKTVKHLYMFIKYGVYNLASKYGEDKLPKTTEELIDIWNNLGVSYVSKDYQAVIQELQNRSSPSTVEKPNEVFEGLFTYFDSKAKNDPMGFGLRVSLFQHEMADLRDPENYYSMNDKERASRIRELLSKFPDVEISPEFHAILVRQASEYLKYMPPHIQREQVFNMQSTLLESAKLSLLLSIGNEKPTYKSVLKEFERFANPKLLRISRGHHAEMAPRKSVNIKLHRAAKEAGLRSLNTIQLMWNAFKGREAAVPIPVGGGRIKFYEASSVRSLLMRHAIVTGDESGGSDILERREAALKEMLKDEILSQYISQYARDRVDNMMSIKYKNIPLNEEEESVLRKSSYDEYFMQLDESLRAIEERTPGTLEMQPGYHRIMQNLLNSYSVEAIRKMPKKYERFMDYLGVQDADGSSIKDVVSGSVVSILHRRAVSH